MYQPTKKLLLLGNFVPGPPDPFFKFNLNTPLNFIDQQHTAQGVRTY